MGDSDDDNSIGALFDLDMSQYPNLSANFSFDPLPNPYQVPVLPKVTNIILQIFVTCTVYL
jgi:hypothetical protein